MNKDNSRESLTRAQEDQLRQLAKNFPHPIDAGDIIDKNAKRELAEMGYVTPLCGTGFHLTLKGLALADALQLTTQRRGWRGR